jgi:hypothetical protein
MGVEVYEFHPPNDISRRHKIKEIIHYKGKTGVSGKDPPTYSGKAGQRSPEVE